eukprot:6475025-Amphidinium_carterae.1
MRRLAGSLTDPTTLAECGFELWPELLCPRVEKKAGKKAELSLVAAEASKAALKVEADLAEELFGATVAVMRTRAVSMAAFTHGFPGCLAALLHRPSVPERMLWLKDFWEAVVVAEEKAANEGCATM